MSGKLTPVVSFVLVFCVVTGAAGAGLTDGLVGHWPLDGDALDASGNGNDGTIIGNVTPTADRLGTPNAAMNFPGTTADYIDLGQPPMLLIKGAMSVAAWVRADTLIQNGRILAKQGGGGNRSWSIQLESAGGFARFDVGINPADRVRADSEPLSFGPDEWFHMAGVFRPGEAVELYVNGVMVKSEPTTVTEQWIENGLSVNIGRRPSPGTPWQGDIDEVRMYNRALTSAEILQVMRGADERLASDPSPGDGAEDVPRDTVLSWTPGIYAPAVNGHRVYLGESFSDVNDGVGGIAHSASSYDPGRLDFETTYYWRVDEVNAPPDSTVYPGAVWSFTTEPVGYPIDGASIAATASSTGQADFGPEKTIDGSGLDPNGLHSTEPTTMWLSDNEPLGAWIQYELDKVHKLHQMWVWNSNQIFEGLFGFGMKDVTVEYSSNGTDWTALAGVPEFAKAPGTGGYAHDTTVDFGGAVAKVVRLTAAGNWGGVLPQYGLSEVRFFSMPVVARGPSPDSGAADVDMDATLAWRAGREAATHDVYLSTDEQAVIDGTAPAVTVSDASYSPALDLGSAYFWRIDEVHDAETPAIWQGDVWDFATQEFIVVDGFEDYNDYPPDEIYTTWLDGYENPANGSQVGYLTPPAIETGIVHGGKQSMPLLYSNTGGAMYSEAARTFAAPQDWTKYGIKALVLYFHGTAGNAGQLYVKINGSKAAYPGDAIDLARPRWKQWGIDLASLGINLQSVTTLAIGVDGVGAGGTLYVDDIGLHPSVPQQASVEIWIEAEAADSITEPMKVYPAVGVDPVMTAGGKGEPSGGSYIGTTSDVPGNNNDPGTQDIATYTFTAPAGTYAIWGRVSNVDDDSLWVHIPDAQYDVPVHSSGWIRWNSIEPETADWHWVRVHSDDAPGNAVVNVTLAAGEHTILWAHRENENFLDAFVITDKLD
ncbi:MAG: LamG-like jellyroll fold domain-containing protein [Planctomycetota bacterium]|jgi:hypothetical protein